ncbi:hypothetical protein ACDH70_12860 [Xanthomonas axonopodis pv. poinsettiicola]|uniref:hypothetical protein n=1 Tax=Xanthomonas TaxID=338 RepID=UPI0035577388
MRIVVPDDDQGAVRQLHCLQRLQGHDVQVLGALATDPNEWAERLVQADALVLIRERTRVDATLLLRLPRLRLISQTGRVGVHVDVAACTQFGVAVVEGVGSPVAPAELTWCCRCIAGWPRWRPAGLRRRRCMYSSVSPCSMRTTPCCSIRACWPRRTWATWNATATSSISRPHSTTYWRLPPVHRAIWSIPRR